MEAHRGIRRNEGALSVALVASLPSEGINGHGIKDLIVTLTFGVVLLFYSYSIYWGYKVCQEGVSE